MDRGADISWLSQYPHEKEILFAPLTGLEILKQRIEGAVIVLDVRLSVNLTSITVEQVVAKMQRSFTRIATTTTTMTTTTVLRRPVVVRGPPPFDSSLPVQSFAFAS